MYISLTFSQPEIEWSKTYGGSDYDRGRDVAPTNDGGYVITGYSYSVDGDITSNNGFSEFWIVKIDSVGNMEWQKSYGGSSEEKAFSIEQTSDGGYVVGGQVESVNDGDVSGFNGVWDHWVVKLDSAGNLEWQKCLGGSDFDYGYAAREVPSGGYISVGDAKSNDGMITYNHGEEDVWVVKLDSVGNMEWQKCYGGSESEVGMDIRPTADGGFVIAGSTKSENGDVTDHFDNYDFWIIKIDSIGSIQWENCYGGGGSDRACSINLTDDGGYIVAGDTKSETGQVTGFHADIDAWIIKIDSVGNLEWQKCVGGSDLDYAFSVMQDLDGRYIFAGYSDSKDGDVYSDWNKYDYWVVKLSMSGNILWQKCMGSYGWDFGRAICQAHDGGYIVAGDALSPSGEVPPIQGWSDYWIIKLPPYEIGVPELSFNQHITIYPNPARDFINIQSKDINSYNLIIMNIHGETVYSELKVNSNIKINVSDYPKGIYVIKISGKKLIEIRKVIIY